MAHINTIMFKEFKRLGLQLGLGVEDIQNIQKKTSKKIVNTKFEPITQPINSYKDPWGGYYGTISIKDFK